MSKAKILTDTFFLLTRTVIVRVISVPVHLIVAGVLGPADYALLRVINYIPMMVKYGNLGFSGVAVRESLHLRGKEKGVQTEREIGIKSNSFSVDIIWIGVLSAVVLILSFGFEPIIGWGMRIAAASLFLNQILAIYLASLKIDKNFEAIAKTSVVGQLCGALFTLCAIWYLRLYGVLLATTFSLCASIIYCRRRQVLNFRFRIERDEVFRQFRIALPLTFGTIAFGAYGWTQRGLVGNMMGLELLGIFMFGLMIFETGTILINQAMTAFQAHLYERLGDDKKNEKEMERLMGVPSYTFAIVSCILGMGLLFLAPPLVNRFLPQYKEVIAALPLVGLSIYAYGVQAPYMHSMNSAHVNQQTRSFIIRVISIAVFSLTTYYLRDSGLTAPFVGTLAASLFLLAGSLVSVAGSFYTKWQRVIPWLMRFAAPLIWSGLFWKWSAPVYDGTFQSGLCLCALFMVWLSPVILFWNKETGILSLLLEKSGLRTGKKS